MTKPARTGPSPEAREILEERAKALARPLEEEAVAATTLELLTFARAGSTYAVPASDAVAVVPLGEPTPVPGTPPAVRGVVNHRGRILAAIDVGRLISPTEPDTSEPDLGIVVSADGASFVLVTDTVPELVSLEEDDVADRAEGPVRGVTGTMAAVLDVSALARDPRVAVDEQLD